MEDCSDAIQVYTHAGSVALGQLGSESGQQFFDICPWHVGADRDIEDRTKRSTVFAREVHSIAL